MERGDKRTRRADEDMGNTGLPPGAFINVTRRTRERRVAEDQTGTRSWRTRRTMVKPEDGGPFEVLRRGRLFHTSSS
jgi:hypothetical protein